MPDYTKIAEQAEASLNTHQAKTGGGRVQADDDAAVNSRAVKDFPGSTVQTGDELSTNRGYDCRIPPNEGGDLDAEGRQTRGQHFEGRGGPHEKDQEFYREQGGANDNDMASGRFTASSQRAAQSGDLAEFGRAAAQDNAPSTGRTQFKGSEYYTPESVQDSISAEGNLPPGSVTQTSRKSEFP
ncbi:hypothetical protein Sste5346_002163 [Sporothrix stenoceras]|uniref:Uncharacterized protein n=1 Tax=Sporothrix stenoceras TaxID=5173 RepID=A0ABR3ZKA5_9PEZI